MITPMPNAIQIEKKVHFIYHQMNFDRLFYIPVHTAHIVHNNNYCANMPMHEIILPARKGFSNY